MSAKPLLIVVTGPTASGKTSLAIGLAQRLGTEIVSADSRQIYKGIPITTAAPSPAERAAAVHHLVETLPLDAYYSAAEFEADASRIVTRLMERNGCAIVCGGSMMYIDALTDGIDSLPTISDTVRRRVQEIAATDGPDAVLEMLAARDPEYFARVDRANTKRVMHALEICLESGQPYSSLLTGVRKERPWRTVKVVTEMERAELFSRINSRVDAMVAAGMEEEARAHLPLRHLNALNTVGFKEWFAHFDGMMDRGTAIERIKKNTRVYAKKQMTWLNRPAASRHETVRVAPGTGVEEILKRAGL